MTVDGVLRADNGQPITQGVLLYHALVSERLILATYAPRGLIEHFLKTQKLTKHVQLLTDVPHLGRAESVGQRPEVFIDPSPQRCADAMRLGITSLLFAAPRYQRPEWRPDADRSPRPWHEILDEQDRQAEDAAADSRLGLGRV